jgi:hypothetical protein
VSDWHNDFAADAVMTYYPNAPDGSWLVKNRAEIPAAQLAELRRGEWGVLRDPGLVSQPAGA